MTVGDGRGSEKQHRGFSKKKRKKTEWTLMVVGATSTHRPQGDFCAGIVLGGCVVFNAGDGGGVWKGGGVCCAFSAGYGAPAAASTQRDVSA